MTRTTHMTQGDFGFDEEQSSPDDGYVADDQAVLEGDVPAQG